VYTGAALRDKRMDDVYCVTPQERLQLSWVCRGNVELVSSRYISFNSSVSGAIANAIGANSWIVMNVFFDMSMCKSFWAVG